MTDRELGVLINEVEKNELIKAPKNMKEEVFVTIRAKKQEIIDEGKQIVEKINKQFKRGLITEEERYASVIEAWTKQSDITSS